MMRYLSPASAGNFLLRLISSHETPTVTPIIRRIHFSTPGSIYPFPHILLIVLLKGYISQDNKSSPTQQLVKLLESLKLENNFGLLVEFLFVDL